MSAPLHPNQTQAVALLMAEMKTDPMFLISCQDFCWECDLLDLVNPTLEQVASKLVTDCDGLVGIDPETRSPAAMVMQVQRDIEAWNSN